MSYRDAPALHPLIYVHGDLACAVDRESGRELWRFSSPCAFTRVLLAYDRVYLLDKNAMVHALDARDGTVLGSVQIEPSGTGGALIAEDGRIYVATTHGACAITPDGKMLWTWPKPDVWGTQILPGLALPGQTCQPDFRDV